MIDFYLASVILFFAIVFGLIYKYRKSIEITNYILFMKRTRRFRRTIDKIAKTSPLFWKIVATIGVLVCLYAMVQGVMLISNTARHILSGGITEPAFRLILPSPVSTGAIGPGFLLIPFWFWIITIAAILVPHELSHGIIARAEGIRLKSVGLLLLGIFPGAFVEPDENKIKKLKLLPKLRIFSAGSAANFLIAGIVLLIAVNSVWPGVTSPGMQIVNVTEGGPAHTVGLRQGMIMTGVNGNDPTPSYNEYFNSEFLMTGKYIIDESVVIDPEKVIDIEVDGNHYYVSPDVSDKDVDIGVVISPVFKEGTYHQEQLLLLITMIWILSFAVGLVNILPLYPLDGGRMIHSILESVFKKRKAKKIVFAISYVILFIMIFDFVGPLILNI